jgi:hypothetical protein
VGISLGNKENLIFGSVALIKDVERERLKPSNVFNTHDNENESEEDEIDPDTSTISQLCGDLTEEVMDDNSAGLDGVLVDVPIKVAKSKKKKRPLNKKVPAKKIVLMKGVFWNCRGLRDLTKHTFLLDVAQNNKLDFIALSETNKNSFSTQCRENFCAEADFVWHWRCPRGMSRGMLMGINQECFEVENIVDGDYHIKFVIKNKVDGFCWALLFVNGAAQEEHKEHFLSELVRACTSCGDLPFLVGGFQYHQEPVGKKQFNI